MCCLWKCRSRLLRLSRLLRSMTMLTIYDMNPTEEELALLFKTPYKTVEEYLAEVDVIVSTVDRVRLHSIRGEHDKAEELTEILEFVSDYYG